MDWPGALKNTKKRDYESDSCKLSKFKICR